MIRKKLWFNFTYDSLLWLQHLSLLATAWKYLYYAKLVYSFFFWFYFRKTMFLFSLFRSASIAIWYCLTDESANAFNSLGISLTACFLNLIGFDFLWEVTPVSHFFLVSLVINWIHVRFILRPLRRALVLVIYAIHIFIINCLNLFVNLKCIFTRLPTSNEEWSTNEISCAEELNRISALVSLKWIDILKPKLDEARPLPRLMWGYQLYHPDFNELNLMRSLVMEVCSFL